MTNRNDSYLEPRVSKLETGLDILTQNVQDLTRSVRESHSAIEDKLERITIAVTQAQSPRRTDWSVIISGILLMLAIGSAVFWPLNQTSENNKTDLLRFEQYSQSSQDSQNIDVNNKLSALDIKLQRENVLALSETATKVTDLDTRIQREFNLKDDEINFRLIRLEKYKDIQENLDQGELRQWRFQAANQTSKAKIPSTNSGVK